MTSRQLRWPSIGLASWRARTFAIICSSRSRPMWRASRRVYSSRRSVYLGRNSWSGGSRRRIVTGSPSIARKIPMKSSRWNGRSFFTAAWRAAESVAMIISRTIGIRSAAKNMCSVRTRPMPSAPNSRAFFASSGVSAFARTPSVRARSAQPRNSLTSSESCGGPPSEQAPARDRPLRVLRVQHGEKELSELARRHAEQRGVLIDDALAHEVHGHAHRGGGPALAGACLQEVELALLDGELDVLHVLVVALEAIGDVEQLVVDRGHPA